MHQATTLRLVSSFTLAIFIAVQLLFVGSVLLIPKPADAFLGFGDLVIKIGDVYQVLKDIAKGILYTIAMNFIQKFIAKFVNKLTEKYKIRNYLYYDQVLTNYYLTNFIRDKLKDPNLSRIFTLLDSYAIQGDYISRSPQDRYDPRKALLPRLKKAIYDWYLYEGGVPEEYIYKPPPDLPTIDYYGGVAAYFYNPPSFVETNLRGQFGQFQAAATSAAQLEIAVGNGLKAGRFIGGTCSGAFSEPVPVTPGLPGGQAPGTPVPPGSGGFLPGSLDSFALLFEKLGLISIAKAQNLPSTPITVPPTPLPQTPVSNLPKPKPKPKPGFDPNSSPQNCQSVGGSWRPSALDQARSFIDNPTSFIMSHLNSFILSKISTQFDPNKFTVILGTVIGQLLYDQFTLNKKGGVLNEDPRGFTVDQPESSPGKEIDIDADGISDGFDYDGDGQIDVCNFGGADGGPGPPCKGSKEAYSSPTLPETFSGGLTICKSDEVSIDVVYHVATNTPGNPPGSPYDRLSVHVDVAGKVFTNPGPDLVDDDAFHMPPASALKDFANVILRSSGGAGAYVTAGPFEKDAASAAGKDRHTVVPDPGTWVAGFKPGEGSKVIDLGGWKGSDRLAVGAFFRGGQSGDGRGEVCTPVTNVADSLTSIINQIVPRLPR